MGKVGIRRAQAAAVVVGGAFIFALACWLNGSRFQAQIPDGRIFVRNVTIGTTHASATGSRKLKAYLNRHPGMQKFVPAAALDRIMESAEISFKTSQPMLTLWLEFKPATVGAPFMPGGRLPVMRITTAQGQKIATIGNDVLISPVILSSGGGTAPSLSNAPAPALATMPSALGANVLPVFNSYPQSWFVVLTSALGRRFVSSSFSATDTRPYQLQSYSFLEYPAEGGVFTPTLYRGAPDTGQAVTTAPEKLTAFKVSFPRSHSSAPACPVQPN